MEGSHTIDLEKLVADKFGGKKLPKPMMAFLKRFFHIDFLNDFFAKGYEGIEFCTETVKALDVTLEVEGLENVPADGTLYTFASNHPLGGVDGVALAGIVGTNYGDLTMLVNDFLMAIPGLRPLGIPVNKVGGQARNLPKLVAEAFSSDKQILIFPAGLCSRKIDGKIQDLPWTKTFVRQSVLNSRPIVPVRFIGSNSRRFYRLANLQKKLGLKFNFAMLKLPDELYKARGKTFKIRFGTPIPPERFDSSKSALEWAAFVRDEVYKL